MNEKLEIDRKVYDALQRELHDYRNLIDTLVSVYESSEEGKHTYLATVMREYVRSTTIHIRKWQMKALEDARSDAK